MKFLSIPLLLLFLYSCQSQKKKETQDEKKYELNVNFFETIKDAHFFAFHGDKQIEIEGLKISGQKLNFDISNYCEKGVYRLYVNELAFDLIYNDEDIEFDVVGQGETPIKVLESDENKLFYDFLDAYGSIKEGGTYCNELSNIKSKINADKGFLASTIIDNILNTDIHCANSKSLDPLSNIKDRKVWLNSPYFSAKIFEALHTAAEQNVSIDTICQRLQKNSNNQLELLAVKNCIWEFGTQMKNSNYLNCLFVTDPLLGANSDHVLNSGKNVKPLKLGDKVQLDEKDFSNAMILFYSKGKGMSSDLEQKWENLEFEGRKVLIDIDKTNSNTLHDLQIVGFPLVLITDENSNLVERLIGHNGIVR